MAKITADWHEKYHYFGTSIDDLKNTKIGFAQSVSDDIKKTINQSISKDTLNRLFMSQGLVKTTKPTTYDILSQYVGYMDWADFKQKFEVEKILEEPPPSVKSVVEHEKIVTEPVSNTTIDRAIQTYEKEIVTEVISDTSIDTGIQTPKKGISGNWVYTILPFLAFMGLAYLMDIATLQQTTIVVVFISMLWLMGYLVIKDITKSLED